MVRYNKGMNFIRHHWKLLVICTVGLLLVAGSIYGYLLYTRANDVVKAVTKSGGVADLLTPEALNGEVSGMVNVLIAGNSADDGGHEGAELTDSIMVASYNVHANKLTLLSIPRDLYVDVSGSYMKINAAYENGGIEELRGVVQTVTGLAINQQALIDYTAFKKMIDAMGGVDVTINSPDPRGIYDPMIGFNITNGLHHLNGTDALLLVRCRNDPTYDGRLAYGLPNGDFDRAANQRMVLVALLTKLASGQALANPAVLQSVIESLSGNVTTDFTAGQLRRVYDISKQNPSTVSVSIKGDDTHNLLSDYKTESAGDTLIPSAGIGNYTAIKAYVASVMTPAQQTP